MSVSYDALARRTVSIKKSHTCLSLIALAITLDGLRILIRTLRKAMSDLRQAHQELQRIWMSSLWMWEPAFSSMKYFCSAFGHDSSYTTGCRTLRSRLPCQSFVRKVGLVELGSHLISLASRKGVARVLAHDRPNCNLVTRY
jgi:hypothetical protein